jgi:hypothetical protein
MNAFLSKPLSRPALHQILNSFNAVRCQPVDAALRIRSRRLSNKAVALPFLHGSGSSDMKLSRENSGCAVVESHPLRQVPQHSDHVVLEVKSASSSDINPSLNSFGNAVAEIESPLVATSLALEPSPNILTSVHLLADDPVPTFAPVEPYPIVP